jgi:hypothetical protein
MTQHVTGRDIRPGQTIAASSIPAFKNVALPALAAAVQAAKMQQKRPRTSELPAILRKDAMD